MTSDELKRAVPIRKLFEDYGFKVDRAGFCKCPFHDDKGPSMKVYDRTGTFHCFGCGKTGDIFTLTEWMEKCSFKTAFEKLGGTYGPETPARLVASYEMQKAMERKKTERVRKYRRLMRIANEIRATQEKLDRLDPSTTDYLHAQRDLYNLETEYERIQL
jgi:DNA primase